ncbi:MAG: T9SS type A sorting domain-containing protein, partial [Bacteroidia bacterium]
VPDPGQKTIQVWDMQGRTVYQENIWGEITEWKLNLSALAAGVYQLSVKKANGELVMQERLIKSAGN